MLAEQKEGFDQAVIYRKQALELARQELGAEHPRFATFPFLLASLLAHLRRFDEAETHYREAQACEKATIGEIHPEYAVTIEALADVLEAKGDYAEAEELRQ